MTIDIGGEFWTAQIPKRRIPGSFTAELGKAVEVDLDTPLSAGLDAGDAPAPRPAPKPGDLAGAMSAAAAGWIAKSRPISFWEQLDTGEPVSVFDATNDARSGMSAHYVAPIAMLGAQVTLEQRYSTVRFRLDHPHRSSHLTDNESSVVEHDQSTLSVEALEDGNWLIYTSSTPATLIQLQMRAITGCLALAQLALFPDQEQEFDLRTRETQVRINSASPWLTVCANVLCPQTRRASLGFPVVPDTELTVERFAKWIALNDKSDGLAWAVARRMKIPIALQVQLLTSLVEGFHRRLTPPHEQTWFPNATKPRSRRRNREPPPRRISLRWQRISPHRCWQSQRQVCQP